MTKGGVATMRVNHLLASTALSTSALFAAGSALAQPMTYSWTGWYAGLNAGGSSTKIDQNVLVPGFFVFPNSGRDRGYTGGVQGGYNLQFAPNWVAGFEGDINDLHAERVSPLSALNFKAGGGTGEDRAVRSDRKCGGCRLYAPASVTTGIVRLCM